MTNNNQKQYRSVRATSNKKKGKITGFIPYGSMSEDLGGFREIITPSAFQRSLKEKDVRALLHHDSKKPLGRVSNGLLKIRNTQEGVYLELTPMPTTDGKDALIMVNHMKNHGGWSFGFRVIKQNVKYDGEQRIHELIDVDLDEFSVVESPAYEFGANIGIRSIDIDMMNREQTDMEDDDLEREFDDDISTLIDAKLEGLFGRITEYIDSKFDKPAEEDRADDDEEEKPTEEETVEEPSDESPEEEPKEEPSDKPADDEESSKKDDDEEDEDIRAILQLMQLS